MNKADNSSQQAHATAEQSTQKEIQGDEGKTPNRGRGKGNNGGKGPNGGKGRGKGNNGGKGRGKGNNGGKGPNGGKGRRGSAQNVNNRTNTAGPSRPASCRK